MRIQKSKLVFLILLIVAVLVACGSPRGHNTAQAATADQPSTVVTNPSQQSSDSDPTDLPEGKYQGANFSITARTSMNNVAIHEVEVFVDVNGDGIFSGYVIPLAHFHLRPPSGMRIDVNYCTSIVITNNQFGSIDAVCNVN